MNESINAWERKHTAPGKLWVHKLRAKAEKQLIGQSVLLRPWILNGFLLTVQFYAFPINKKTCRCQWTFNRVTGMGPLISRAALCDTGKLRHLSAKALIHFLCQLCNLEWQFLTFCFPSCHLQRLLALICSAFLLLWPLSKLSLFFHSLPPSGPFLELTRLLGAVPHWGGTSEPVPLKVSGLSSGREKETEGPGPGHTLSLLRFLGISALSPTQPHSLS